MNNAKLPCIIDYSVETYHIAINHHYWNEKNIFALYYLSNKSRNM